MLKKSMTVVSALGLVTLVNCSCFVRGTRIVTPRGMRRIEDLVVGDEVWSLDVETRKPIVRKVEKLLRSRATELLRVAAGELIVVGVTPEHPFYDGDNRVWAPARNLREGTTLLAWLGSSNVREIEISAHRSEAITGSVDVFNMTVEGPEHNYFAEGLLVHNKAPPIEPGGYGGDAFAGALCQSDADCAEFGLFCAKVSDGMCGEITRQCESREWCNDIPLQTVCGCDGKLYATRYQCPGDDQVVIDKRDGACAPPVGQFNCGDATCNIETEYCLEDFTEIKCVELPPACQGPTPTCSCLGDQGVESCMCVQHATAGVTVQACKN
jgi:hypothetical protein